MCGLLLAPTLLLIPQHAAENDQRTWREPKTGMVFVRIPAGSFLMGSPTDEPEREAIEKLHRVRISRDFYLGRYEVTQAEWQLMMGENPSHFRACGPRCPVERVNYFQALEFIDRLNRLHPDESFRLPTEAEWEYACRAGTTTPYYTGRQLTTDQANYDGNFPSPGASPGINHARTLPVGSFAPNAWGLYDMHGNVWEWCADWHCPYPTRAVSDPIGHCQTDFRVIRGGSWCFNAQSARSALRYTHRPQDFGYSVGFRLVRAARGKP
jgi:formylglycine-generating enzyme required for sulfatase activity